MAALNYGNHSRQVARKRAAQGPWVVEMQLRHYYDEICDRRRTEALLLQLRLLLRLGKGLIGRRMFELKWKRLTNGNTSNRTGRKAVAVAFI